MGIEEFTHLKTMEPAKIHLKQLTPSKVRGKLFCNFSLSFPLFNTNKKFTFKQERL